MTDIILINNKTNTAANTRDVFYNATDKSVTITAFTAANNTESSKSYKAYITTTLGEDVDPVQPFTVVVRDKASLGIYLLAQKIPKLLAQKIPKGGALEIESSDADSLSFYVTGRQD
jgi:hypothetical protein